MTPQAAAIFQKAMEHFRRGELPQAVGLFEKGLELVPNSAAGLHFLGLSYHQLRNVQKALPLLYRAVETDPGQVVYAINLGRVLTELGRLDEALAILEKARQRGVNAPELFDNLGQVQLALGRVSQATEHLRHALELQPAFPSALNSLGIAYSRLGRYGEAIASLQAAQRLVPRAPEILNNLGRVYLLAGQAQQSVNAHKSALLLDPGNMDASLSLAKALEESGQLEQALEICQGALVRHAKNTRLLVQMGTLLRSLGQFDRAHECFVQAVESAPRFFPARWQAELDLPIFYASEAAMEQARSGWMEGVERLERALNTQAFDASSITLPHTNFYLHYQCGDDREAQGRYGKLVSAIAKAQMPGLAVPQAKGFAGNRKIRVGFVSAFFNLHTIFKLFHGWILNLDPKAFETFVFHFSNVQDKATEHLAKHATGFVSGPLPLPAAAEAILKAELDILIYPDIGMDSLTQMLAALRLVPVQCQSWGHPVTSGLPTIDYFLSSELMEPPGSEAQYHEKLVCLPGLSIYYPTPEVKVAAEPPGVPAASGTRFVCLQSLFKLLPRQDELVAKIAARVPGSQFLFIGHPSAHITALYRNRMEEAFRKVGVDPFNRIHFLPQLKYGEFLGLARAADVILDSVGWSGGNTTLEALAFAKPIVTLPGLTLRGRHTMGILKRIGVTETIAQDEGEYVELAVRLAEDIGWREHVSEGVQSNSVLAYNDKKTIEGLEGFVFWVFSSSALSLGPMRH